MGKDNIYHLMAETAYDQLRFFTWYMYRLGAYSHLTLEKIDNNTHNLMAEVQCYINAQYMPAYTREYLDCNYDENTPQRFRWFCCKNFRV